jgi:hypothetical protein
MTPLIALVCPGPETQRHIPGFPVKYPVYPAE